MNLGLSLGLMTRQSYGGTPTTPLINTDWTLEDAGTQTSREGFATFEVQIDVGARPGIIAVFWSDQTPEGVGVEPTIALGGGRYRLSSAPDEFGSPLYWHESAAGVSRPGIRLIVLEAGKTASLKSDAKSGTPTTVPSAPGVGTMTAVATGSPDELEIELSAAPATGGSAITGYERSLSGGAWVALAGDPSATPQVTAAPSGLEYAVRVRAVNANGAGWESLPVNATPTAALWTPAEIAEMVAVWVADDATVTVDGSDNVTAWASTMQERVSPYTLTPPGAGRATYSSANGSVTGVDNTPLRVALDTAIAKVEGITILLGLKPADTTDFRSIVSGLTSSQNWAINGGPWDTNMDASVGSWRIVRSSVIDGTPDRVHSAFNGVEIYDAASAGFSPVSWASFDVFGGGGVTPTAEISCVIVLRRTFDPDDADDLELLYKLEGWAKHNVTALSGVSLIALGGVEAHPYNVTAPGGGAAPPLAIDAGPDLRTSNATLTGLGGADYRLTMTTNGQLWASEAFVAAPMTHYRLTGSVKADTGNFVQVRVGRDGALSPAGVPADEDYQYELATYSFVVERTIEGDGTAQAFTLDFVAPRGLLYAGVRQMNALSGDEVEVTGLTLAAAPQTVAIGATTTATAIEHDGVIFRLRHRVSGDPVTVGRYAVDGQYWALNDDPADPVEVWQMETVGQGIGMQTVTNLSYTEYGTPPAGGATQAGTAAIGKVHGGAMLNTWQSIVIFGGSQDRQAFDQRTEVLGYLAGYQAAENIEPSANANKPIVFETAMGADWSATHTIESDRIAAPREATLVKQVGLDMQHDIIGRSMTERYVTLTIVTAAPSATALRPPSVLRGVKAPKVVAADIDYTPLLRLATPTEVAAKMPLFAELEYILSRPQNANISVWPKAMPVIGRSSGGTYGRVLSANWGYVFAALIYDHFTAAEQERLADLIVQFGVDIAAYVNDPVMRRASPDGESLGWYGPVLRMAAALTPGVAWLEDAADGAVMRRLAEDWAIQRVPQAMIDRKMPVASGDPAKATTLNYSPGALGMPDFSQYSTFDVDDWGSGKKGDYLPTPLTSAPYRGQNTSGSMFQMLAAWRIPAMRTAWNRDVTLEFFDRAFAMDLAIAANAIGLASGDKLLGAEKAAWIANRSDGRPVSAQRWGLDWKTITNSNGAVDILPVIRPAYPGATGTFIDLAVDEFFGGVLTGGVPTSYAVDTTPATIGEMTTTGSLPTGFSLNTSTGVITLTGAQVATPLRWVKIDASNGAGAASAIVAIECAANYLRSLHVRNITGAGLAFGAEIQGAAGGAGTLYWVLYDEEAMTIVGIAERTYDGAKPRPSAAQIEAGAVGSGSVLKAAGSVATTTVGEQGPFGPPASTAAASRFYAVSLLWKPTTGAAPDPLHLNLLTLP